jgi:hypothetical protein
MDIAKIATDEAPGGKEKHHRNEAFLSSRVGRRERQSADFVARWP